MDILILHVALVVLRVAVIVPFVLVAVIAPDEEVPYYDDFVKEIIDQFI